MSQATAGDHTQDEESAAHSIDGAAIQFVPVNALLPADSPRLNGEEMAHARMLAQTEAVLPPILVHRATMRVVDGMHRVLAAKIQGRSKIAIRYVDGTDDDVFLLAVQENIRHGLPLSLADRKAAAVRIITTYPEWSDRAVGAATGLAARTIRGIRRRSADHLPRSNTRIGRDGRVRPLNGAEGRRRALEVIAKDPQASLREIARQARISLGTAHSVRTGLAADDGRLRAVPGKQSPAAPEQPGNEQPATPPPATPLRGVYDRRETAPLRGADDRRETLGWREIRPLLQRDPALRYTESGRALLEWLNTHAIDPTEWQELVSAVPSHWSDLIASIALERAEEWRKFAAQLR
jgi:ParB-like chromosome segregation protein Spo0J